MMDVEVHLRCLELAMEQAKREGKHADVDSVLKIETLMYNHVNSRSISPEPPVKGKGKAAADKSAPIFE